MGNKRIRENLDTLGCAGPVKYLRRVSVQPTVNGPTKFPYPVSSIPDENIINCLHTRVCESNPSRLHFRDDEIPRGRPWTKRSLELRVAPGTIRILWERRWAREVETRVGDSRQSKPSENRRAYGGRVKGLTVEIKRQVEIGVLLQQMAVPREEGVIPLRHGRALSANPTNFPRAMSSFVRDYSFRCRGRAKGSSVAQTHLSRL